MRNTYCFLTATTVKRFIVKFMLALPLMVVNVTNDFHSTQTQVASIRITITVHNYSLRNEDVYRS